MHLGNQRPVLVPESYWRELEALSKAALMDVVWSFAVRCCGQEDMPRRALDEFFKERDAVLAIRKHEAKRTQTPLARAREG
jgi:hypothetical protein